MAIEVTSLSDRGSFFRTLPRPLSATFAACSRGKHRLLLNSVVLVVAATLATATFTLIKSYRFYAQIIDARLADGYLTCRPGIYAAPRTISTGERISRDALLASLRRAGYTETSASEIWSGSFKSDANMVEIRPSGQSFGPEVVRVAFDQTGRVSALTGDGVTLPSFALEPEVLTNDLRSKSGQRTQLTYSDLPVVLVHAILSIEDRRFFDHSGVDVFGVLRALMRNASDEQLGQGGSTITQQLVKNTYLSPERTLRRKFAEAMLSLALERRLSKEDIFALYCNEVYLGQHGAVTVRGVEQAARVYFSKDVKDLSLAEAAMIAGMIQGPARYSPVRHAEAAVARRNLVLGTMARDGWINLAQANAAATEALVVTPTSNATESMAPYFVDYVNRVAESHLSSVDARAAGQPGMPAHPGVIYTTIDLDLQQVAEAAIKRQLDRLDQVYKNRDQKPQAALVALDPRTGAVLAMVGGRNYADSQLNRAVDARRQPGSTFKPFVYAAALESGLSPVQLFADVPRDFIYDRDRVYRPKNYGGGFSMRDVTMRTGLVKSLNVVTVDVAMQTGLARIANLTERFGLPKPDPYPALALGTTEVTPLQLATAYATFVNGGTRVEPRLIVSIGEPRAAHTLEANEERQQVVKPTTAYMITNMLSAVVDRGTAQAARGAVKGTAIAGKTGTSRDGWFVGYTPNLVCVVWIGFDDNQQLGLTGAEAALPAWTEFINGAIAARPELGGRGFECPEGIKFVEIDSEDGLLATLACPNRELIAISDALAPNAECFRHLSTTAQPTLSIATITQSSAAPDRPELSTRPSPFPAASRFRSTRIDVDARGRRALVTDMR